MPLTAEYRLLVPRATWMTARARNAMHRPIFIGAVSVSAFVGALCTLVLMPQQAQKKAQAIAPKPGERPDTMPLALRVAQLQAQLAAADTALSDARRKVAVLAEAPIDTLNPTLTLRRDSLAGRISELERLLARTETAPLAGSYRALGESRELASDARVKALLDSLTDIEREREAIGTSGGADAVSVALTSRATEIGRAIQGIGAQRRDALRAEVTALAPPQRPSPVEVAEADTLRRLAARDSLRASLAVATADLGRARRLLLELDRRADRAREIAMNAPPYALLAAAMVFGIVLGFGFALVKEIRRPRIADAHEAERVAGVRVISVIRPRPASPERGRRLADRMAPPHIDPGNDAHQLVWLFVAPPASSLLMLTVTGEDSAVAAIVAANLGAIAADEARNVILIDTDARSCPVASALRVNAEPGIHDILDGRLRWPETTQHATIGRDRVVDVVASGTAKSPGVPAISSLLRAEAPRLARHYDTVIVVATKDQTLGGLPGALPMHDVIYCARIGHTKLADLKKSIAGIRQAGGTPLGIVLWDDVPPALLTPAELAADPRRPHRTAEMEAFVGGRTR